MLTTIGYEGADRDALIETLKRSGVQTLVDVRERAQSRRPGFSKTALKEALEREGLGYVHLRALGTPPALRKPYHLDHDFEKLRRGFMAHLATQGEALEGLAELAAREQVCLLCYEADAHTCHRLLIVERLSELGLLGGGVRHLRVGEPL